MARLDPATLDSDLAVIADIQRRFRMQDSARPSRPPDYRARRGWLDALEAAVQKHEPRLLDALQEDFGNRSRHESMLAEIIPVLHEIRFTRRHLRRWMRPVRVGAGWQLLPASAQIVHQPLGIVGILAPWNYPVNLTLWPLVSALAAGNQAMLKPSENAPRTADALRELVEEAFAPEQVCVVLGDADVAAAFTRLPFDHLLFTGSTSVGRKVLAAAADNLTPVTLELGGKCPTIVDEDYPLRTAVQRIMTGKLMNAGQTCVAPDYVLVHEDRLDAFVATARQVTRDLYPDVSANPDYTCIIDDAKLRRLREGLTEAVDKGARVVPLTGEDEPLDRRLPPSLLLDCDEDALFMREEIFGPVLPVMPFRELDEAIAYVNARPRPLALYYFGSRRDRQQRIVNETMSGGVAINDVVVHVAASRLPFGGIGPSGMGHYHGRAGFMTFSKPRGVFRQRRWSPLSLLAPPYGGLANRMLRFLRG